MTELRDYQKESIGKIYASWETNKSVLMQMPTGTGKTVVFCDIVKKESSQNRKVLIVAHKEEIIQQIIQRLDRYQIPHGIIKAGYEEERDHKVQVASIQTLDNRERPPADYVIIDEAHHAIAKTYRDLWKKYPSSNFLGVTATPIRLSGEGFEDLLNTDFHGRPNHQN